MLGQLHCPILIVEHPLKLLREKSGKESGAVYDDEIITFLNPYSYLSFRKDTRLFALFDRIYFDGIILVKATALMGIRSGRKSFDMTSLAPEIFTICEETKKNIYFIGSDRDSIRSFIRVISEAYPSLNIQGWRNGFFKSREERQATLQNIFDLAPDFLAVGMGSPLQEEFLSDLKSMGWKGVGFTCGGFIHQTAKGLNYYPRWMDNLHLRWLYRIWDEPKLLKRYLLLYPWFVGLFIYDLFTFGQDNSS
jgi:N-acetylglucosaminyldiphosphoundecaprenol N-acetyl-beta-D-mannosaminyltransferase